MKRKEGHGVFQYVGRELKNIMQLETKQQENRLKLALFYSSNFIGTKTYFLHFPNSLNNYMV